MPVTLEQIESLDTDEKIQLAEKLWQSIEAERSQPMTDTQKALLEKRLNEHKLNPLSGKSWSTIKNKYSV
ncbi:MAG TPA: addiction module protein [Panacibacter sp.]|nr:addiction module protein [Panacibacter sp.]